MSPVASRRRRNVPGRGAEARLREDQKAERLAEVIAERRQELWQENSGGITEEFEEKIRDAITERVKEGD